MKQHKNAINFDQNYKLKWQVQVERDASDV